MKAEDHENVKTKTAVTEVRTEIVEPQENQVILGSFTVPRCKEIVFVLGKCGNGV